MDSRIHCTKDLDGICADRANLCRGFPKVKLKLQDAIKDVIELDDFWSTEMKFSKVMLLQQLSCWTF